MTNEHTGLPSTDDPDVRRLTTAVFALPETAQQEIIRTLYRAAVAWDRDKDPRHLQRLAEAALATAEVQGSDRLRRAVAHEPKPVDRASDLRSIDDLAIRAR